MRLLLIIPAIALLGACSTISDLFPTAPNNVAALESALSAADTAAMAYVNLPTCVTGGPVLCSKKSVIISIGKSASAAYVAVKAAEASENQTTIGAAQTAVAALQSIVSTVSAGN